jgi:hypothetical protein
MARPPTFVWVIAYLCSQANGEPGYVSTSNRLLRLPGPRLISERGETAASPLAPYADWADMLFPGSRVSLSYLCFAGYTCARGCKTL